MEVHKEVACTCGDCIYNNIVRCEAKLIWVNDKGKCKTFKKKDEDNKDEDKD